MDRSHTTNLRAYLNALEQKEANTLKRSSQQEIIKLMSEPKEITKQELKEKTQNSRKP